MYRIKEDHEAHLEIKKSRFITYLHRINNEEEAKDYIMQIRKAHPNATHHCYAFLIGEHNEIRRSNDDGEPSGTAGVPMLECLDNSRVQDIVAVTVRYFGGIKLGAGGLIRAYAKSVSHALQSAVLTRKQWMKQYRVTFGYERIGRLDHFLRERKITILDKEYREAVRYTYLSETDIQEELQELTSGSCQVEFQKDVLIEAECGLPREQAIKDPQ